MPIRVTCPGCNRTIEAPDAAAGKSGKCTTCGAMISVPAAEAAPQEPPDVEIVAGDTVVGPSIDATQYQSPPPLPSQPRQCPFCSEEIKGDARKCKHCGEYLDPSLRADEAQQRYDDRQHANRWLHPIQVPTGPSPFWGRVSKFGAFAAVICTFSVFWLVDAISTTKQMIDAVEAGHDTTVFQEIYELLTWWSALQMLMLSVALAAWAGRLHRADREAADTPTPSD